MKHYFSKFINKRLTVLLAAILLLAVILAAYIVLVNMHNTQQSVTIDILGRQRMLTQQIAKNANRKYAIMKSLEDGPLITDAESLQNKIVLIDEELLQAQEQFAATLDSLHSGMLTKDTYCISVKNTVNKHHELIIKLDNQWEKFTEKVDILRQSSQVDPNTAAALQLINESNDALLQTCDDVTQAAVADKQQEALAQNIIALSLVGIILLFLCLLVHRLRKEIISPLNELYGSLAQRGVLWKSNEKEYTTPKSLTPVIATIKEGFYKLDNIIELISHINKNISFQDILDYIYNSFRVFIPYVHIGIALLGEDQNTLVSSYTISDPDLGNLPQKLVGLQAELRSTSLGNVIRQGQPRVIQDLAAYTKGKPLTPYNELLLASGIRSSITLPLLANGQPVGAIFFSSNQPNIYQEEHIKTLSMLADSLAIALNQNIFIDELLYSSVLALAKLAEARDEDTGEHLNRMKLYSKTLARCLMEDGKYTETIDMQFIKDIERFAPMHDIGKVGVRDGLLLKPGKLTPNEFEEMKNHTIYGAQVLRTAEEHMRRRGGKSIFGMGIEIALCHQEKWDGSGYPYGKSRYEIPLSARIVSVGDVLDALTSKRPYKSAFPFAQSFQMMAEESGTHFDPAIIDTFIRHRLEFEELYITLHREL